MFGIGLPEMIVILVVALVVVGPDKLPEMARSLAKVVNDLKGTLNQVKDNLSEETKVISSVQQDLQKTALQMKDHLLESGTSSDAGDTGDTNDAKIWRPEDALPDEQATDTDDEDDIIDMQAFEERPWEKDAAAEPVKKEVVDDDQQKDDHQVAAATTTDTEEVKSAEDKAKSDKTTADNSKNEVAPPSTTV